MTPVASATLTLVGCTVLMSLIGLTPGLRQNVSFRILLSCMSLLVAVIYAVRAILAEERGYLLAICAAVWFIAFMITFSNTMTLLQSRNDSSNSPQVCRLGVLIF